MKLACKDINPTTDCTFEVEGDTKSEIASQMKDHAKIVHADDLKDMSDEDIMEMMESKVHE